MDPAVVTLCPFPIGPHSPKISTHSFIQNSFLTTHYVLNTAGDTVVSKEERCHLYQVCNPVWEQLLWQGL